MDLLMRLGFAIVDYGKILGHAMTMIEVPFSA
jgi:hypothetical protein